jgi:acetyl-CoA carboxylase biotin carboxyl carrier protein
MPDVAAEEQPLEGAELLILIDRLEQLMHRFELDEIEVEADGTGLVLRSPAAIEPRPAGRQTSADGAIPAPLQVEPSPQATGARAIVAPLTGLFYVSPSPGAEPYVREGADIHVGQVIGLIEAMKLFNEIKSDVAGRVVRICVESGSLVKAQQPLIEVEP